MSRLLLLLSAVPLLSAGCRLQVEPAAPQTTPQPELHAPRPHQPAVRVSHALPSPARPPLARRAAPLEVIGTWVPSGWMGSAADGGLRYRVHTKDPHYPTCEEWIYDPSHGSLTWAAAAYQYPDSNWCDQPGKDLSDMPYTTLRFAARGQCGGERVIFKSGGHTRAGARYPTSYESSLGVVTLSRTWETYRLPLGRDRSNVPAAFTLITNRHLCPKGAVIYLADLVFVEDE